MLEWRPVAWLGSISYGLYLWHGLVFELTPSMRRLHWLTDAGVFLFVLVVSVLVSWISWRWFEQPVLGWASRRAVQPVPAAV